MFLYDFIIVFKSDEFFSLLLFDLEILIVFYSFFDFLEAMDYCV